MKLQECLITLRAADRRGLTSLPDVRLNPRHAGMLAGAAEGCRASAPLRARLQAEARDVLALSQLAPAGRLQVAWLSLDSALRMVLLLRVPVPQRPGADNQLRVAPYAALGLFYPHEAIHDALPGAAFFEFLEPHDTWHPNIGTLGPSPVSRLCLGTTLMAGVRCADLVLMAYGAVSMQTTQIDERDPAGVLNIEAARWWQQNLQRAPLTRVPFLSADEATPPIPTRGTACGCARTP